MYHFLWQICNDGGGKWDAIIILMTPLSMQVQT
jgi:hypothetical protein